MGSFIVCLPSLYVRYTRGQKSLGSIVIVMCAEGGERGGVMYNTETGAIKLYCQSCITSKQEKNIGVEKVSRVSGNRGINE